jgi:hypothetical protein
LTVSHRDGETLQLNVCGKLSPVFRAKLPASFEPLCAWLALRDLPFGLMDLYDVDLPAGAHNNLLMLVGGLCRAGLLRAEPNALEALSGLYPMTRNGGSRFYAAMTQV